MNEALIKKVFFSNSKNKLPLSEINQRDYKNILSIADEGLLYSYVLKKIIFKQDETSNPLIRDLQMGEKLCLIKKKQLILESKKISKIFSSEDINHVFLKGISIHFNNFDKENIRFSRDIDILVEKKRIIEAYNLLKEMDYQYLDNYVEDNASFISNRHHLPILINKAGSLVEIHSRITKKRDFSQCPISDSLIQNKIQNTEHRVYLARSDYLFTHILYHGSKNNTLGSKIQMKLDISSFINSNDINIPPKDLIKLLNLNFKNNFFTESINNNDFESFQDEINNQKLFLSRLIFFANKIVDSFRTVEDRYQVKSFTFLYLIKLVLDIKRKLKKVIRKSGRDGRI